MVINAPADLIREFNLYLQDFAASTLDPHLINGGVYYTEKSFGLVAQYNLYQAVRGLVLSAGPIGFSNGISLLKHDFGYQPYAIVVYGDKVQVTFRTSGKKVKKLDRKIRQLTRLAEAGELPTLTGFGLKIEWRFEGGQ